MRTSQYLLSTLKETPADAEVISHQLMLRAGMIRKLASGLYTWLPTGVRVLKKVENIVREEMNNAGAIEVLMPVSYTHLCHFGCPHRLSDKLLKSSCDAL